MSTYVLEYSSELIAEPLCDIINTTFQTGIFPYQLKKAKIIPLHKKGEFQNINNYRPVSILPIFSKVVEKIIFNQLVAFIEKYKILSNSQFGFRRGKSTADALLDLTDMVMDNFETGVCSLGVFVDLSKAFDCVSHSILLYKLDYYGVRGISLSIFETYLSGRTQSVFYQGKLSGALSNEKGVPQGSILGPLLFLIYINDLPALSPYRTILFADDTTFVTKLTKGECSDSVASTIMATANQWFVANKLQLNIDKTNVIKFSKNVKDNMQHTKFLGVYVDSKLSWKVHIEQLCSKLSSITYAIRRVRQTVGVDAAIATYYAMFQSILTYGIITWGTAPNTDQVFILQKRAIRAIANIPQTKSCEAYFQQFNILTYPSLVIFYNLVFLHENNSKFKKNIEFHDYDTRNASNISMPLHRLAATDRTLLGIRLYNKLPSSLRTLPIIPFKNKLKSHLIRGCYYKISDFKM